MNHRISDAFQRVAAEGRAAFIPYLCGGDPDFDRSLAACRGVLAGGADLLEIGVAFSDPLADGPTNQRAAERALTAGMTPARTLELVRAVRAGSTVPVILYIYYNLIFAWGEEDFARAAVEAGVDALLVLDLPPEESADLRAICGRAGLGLVFIVAPTTPPERLPIIAQAATSFLYYVSRTGVTGVTASLAVDLRERVGAIRAVTSLPVVVGFGVSTPEQVAAVAAAADGVVVGSALVNILAERASEPAESIANSLESRVRELVAGTRRAR